MGSLEQLEKKIKEQFKCLWKEIKKLESATSGGTELPADLSEYIPLIGSENISGALKYNADISAEYDNETLMPKVYIDELYNEVKTFVAKLSWSDRILSNLSPKVFGNGVGQLGSIGTLLNENNIFDVNTGRFTNNTTSTVMISIKGAINFGLEDWGTNEASVYMLKSNGQYRKPSVVSRSYISGTNIKVVFDYTEILNPGEYVVVNVTHNGGSDKTMAAAGDATIESYMIASITKK